MRARPFTDATDIVADGEKLRAIAERDGHLLVREAVPQHLLAPLRTLVLRQCHALGWLRSPATPVVASSATLTGTGYDDPRWVSLQQSLLGTAAFRDVGACAGIVEVLRQILQSEVMTGRGDICRVGWPGAPHLTTPPHQDHFYVGGSTRIWTAWIPLMDCSLDDGPLAVALGSHRRGLLRHDGDGAGRQGVDVCGDERWATQPLAAGDAVFFHCMTLHKALPNVSADRLRLSVDYRFQPLHEQLDTRRVDGTDAAPAVARVDGPEGAL